MVKSERMSPVDTTWLRMGRTENPMVIVGVLILDGPVDLDRIERTIGQRVLGMHRRFVAAGVAGSYAREGDLARLVGHLAGETHPLGTRHRSEHGRNSTAYMRRGVGHGHGVIVPSTSDVVSSRRTSRRVPQSTATTRPPAPSTRTS